MGMASDFQRSKVGRVFASMDAGSDHTRLAAASEVTW
jgi:hypothetical protein